MYRYLQELTLTSPSELGSALGLARPPAGDEALSRPVARCSAPGSTRTMSRADTGLSVSGRESGVIARHAFGGVLILATGPLLAASRPGSTAGPTTWKHSAEARQALGGSAWGAIHRIRLEGTIDAGDAPGIFVQVIDERTGHNRLDVHTGSLEDISGFDGGAWSSQNGIVTGIDLPSLVEDARSYAFVLRNGWRDPGARAVADGGDANRLVFHPAGGSRVTITFDPATHLPSRAVIDADDGARTYGFEDWRRVRGVQIPFLETISDPTGAKTILKVRRAETSGVSAAALERPTRQKHGHLDRAAAPTSFEFAAFDRGHIIVPATINRQPVRLVFDTGAANYLAPESARALGLAVAGGVNIAGVGEGSESGGFAHLQSVSIGAASLTNEAAIVGPLPYPATHPRAGLSVAGLTGYEFLSEFRTTIDYSDRTIGFASFRSPRLSGGVTIPFHSDGHSIYIEASIEGVPGLFRLDTGDGGAVTLFRSFADRHGLFRDGGRASVQAGGLGGTLSTRDLVGRSFRLAAATLSNVPVSISDTRSGAFFSRSLAGNLGAGLLSRFTITFDYRAHVLTFAPNRHFADPFGRDRSGLSVTQREPDALQVLAVATGSPADRAGIRAGDRITAVDGRSVSAQHLGAFDLSPLRLGNRPFRLTLARDGRSLDAVIVPADFD